VYSQMRTNVRLGGKTDHPNQGRYVRFWPEDGVIGRQLVDS
jgi:hypothetical protein